MSEIEFEQVSKYYGHVCAVRNLSLVVERGEFFSLLGPSGSGKTTVLRIIAGFLRPSEGVIRIAGTAVTSLPPEKRGIGMVFQNYALFPHLTVFENIAFGLRARKLDQREIERRVQGILEKTGLAGYERRLPRELSGGEQQRVAVARALVIEPNVLLLDEPLGALDRLLREQMQYWIKAIQNETKVTTIYVTHDQVEALTMSDRIAVLYRGSVEQVGEPGSLYRRPRTRFVASFMGDNNVFDGRVDAVADKCSMVKTSEGLRLVAERRDLKPGTEVVVAVRPEEIVMLAPSMAGARENSFPGRVLQRVYRGAVNRYSVEVAGGARVVHVDSPGRMEAFGPGDNVVLSWEPESSSVVV